MHRLALQFPAPWQTIATAADAPIDDVELVDDAALAHFFLRWLQPGLVGFVLVTLAFWHLMLLYGSVMIRVAPGQEDEDEFAGLSKDMQKKKRKRLRKEAEEAPKHQPRRLILLTGYLLIAFLHFVDAAAVIVYAILFSHSPRLDEQSLAQSVLSVAVYWTTAALIFPRKSKAKGEVLSNPSTRTLYLHCIAAITVFTQPCALLALAYAAASAGHLHPLVILQLATTSARSVLALAVGSAYLPKLQEPIAQPQDTPAEENMDSLQVDGNGNANNSPSDDAGSTLENGDCTAKDGDAAQTSKDDTGEDDDDNDEEDEKPKARTYDLLAMYRRIRRLWPYLAPVQTRGVQIILVVCMLLTFSSTAVSVLLPRQTGIVAGKLSKGEAPWDALVVWTVLRIAVGYSGLVQTLRATLWLPVRQRATVLMNIGSFQHVLLLSARYHNNKKTGEVLNVLNRASAVTGFLDTTLFTMLPLFLDIATAGAYVSMTYGFKLAVTIACTGAAYAGVMLASRKTLINYSTEINERSDRTASNKNESIANIELVKYFSAEQYEANRYEDGVLRNQAASFEQSCYSRLSWLAEEVVTEAGILVGAFIVAKQVVVGAKDVGAFVAYTFYMSQLLGRVGQLVWMNDYFSSLMTSTDKLMDILEEENEIVDAPDARELYKCTGEIEFDNVTFLYDDPKARKAGKEAAQGPVGQQEAAGASANGHANGAATHAESATTKKKKIKEPRKALQNVSFKVKPGQHVALVGETGSGKSTIFRLLFRFFDVTEGSIKVDGRDIREYTQSSLRRAFGVVQQEGSLFNDSILANIRYGNITATDAEVVEVAKIAKIYDRIQQWPKKFSTVVGDRGVKLSGGEKQRVSIARTLLRNPDVLLLDEATSALDTATEKDIQAQLQKLTEGKTCLTIAHRLSTIAHADLILVLKDGKIVERGTHEELLQIEDGQYKKLWEAQSSAGKGKDEGGKADEGAAANDKATPEQSS